jgi:hypothetical protein
MIVALSIPAFAQENKIVNISGVSIQVFPFPQSLAGMPMRISFNGDSGASDSSGTNPPAPVHDLSSNEPLPPDDLSTHLSRFRAYLFQYLDMAGPASAGLAGDTFTAVPDYQNGPDTTSEPGSEQGQGVSVKIQADVSEKSGALIFVLKI